MKKKPLQKCLSLFTALLMVAAVFSFMVQFGAGETHAAAGEPAIILVTDGSAPNISGGQKSSVWFGSYKQSPDGSGDFNMDPIKWRVLENADKRLFLLSDQNLDAMIMYPSNARPYPMFWVDTPVRSWLNGIGSYTNDSFIGSAFSSDEQSAILTTDNYNEDNYDFGTPNGPNASALNNTKDKVFLLTYSEVMSPNYGFENTDGASALRIATNTAYTAKGGRSNSAVMSGVGEADGWWLRGIGNDYGYWTPIYDDGTIGGYGEYPWGRARGIRPAFHFDLTAALFTSSAQGGKSSGVVGPDAFKEIGSNAIDEWKMTVKDTRHSTFTASATPDSVLEKLVGYDSWEIAIDYSEAQTGEREYVSAVLVDEDDNVLYYGRFQQPSTASGRIDVSIPTGLAEGTYTLKVFNEEYNGDCFTDYASSFSDIPLTVSKEPEVFTVTVNDDGNGTGSSNPSSGVSGTAVTITAIPNAGYEFNKWEVISGGVTLADANSVTTTFSIGDANVEVKATFKTIQKVKVSFDSDGGTPVPAQEIYVNTKATKPTDPVKEGYIFSGWHLEEELFDFETPVKENIELKAKWTSHSVPPAPTMLTITYDLNGGVLDGKTGIVKVSVEKGTTITLPSPTREGYTFDYWEGSVYHAGDGYTVNEDHTFTAQWKQEPSRSVPNTGDETPIGVWAGVMLMSGMLLQGWLKQFRKKRPDTNV